MNYISYPYPGYDWEKYYLCDPQNFQGTKAEKDLVIGGQANIWSEFVDQTNLISRLWPRASAVAERLWSNPSETKDVDDARHRLDLQRCRMLRRGQVKSYSIIQYNIIFKTFIYLFFFYFLFDIQVFQQHQF